MIGKVRIPCEDERAGDRGDLVAKSGTFWLYYGRLSGTFWSFLALNSLYSWNG
jgi:hypothetical protein